MSRVPRAVLNPHFPGGSAALGVFAVGEAVTSLLRVGLRQIARGEETPADAPFLPHTPLCLYGLERKL